MRSKHTQCEYATESSSKSSRARARAHIVIHHEDTPHEDEDVDEDDDVQLDRSVRARSRIVTKCPSMYGMVWYGMEQGFSLTHRMMIPSTKSLDISY